MGDETVLQKLLDLLRDLGVRTLDDRLADGQSGFPLSLPFADGQTLVLDLPSPAAFTTFDPDAIGVAILDPLGYVRRTWGLAGRIPFFLKGKSLLETPIAEILESGFQGAFGSLYLGGYRYLCAPVDVEGIEDLAILVLNASEEKIIRSEAGKSARTALALKRLGKALTMNQKIQPLCHSAAHEIASVGELAAVLIWVREEGEELHLLASVGVNRQGQAVLSHLAPNEGGARVAEIVAASRRCFTESSVLDHVLTANLEAKICYLKPGGIAVHPLVISDNLLGVLEIVGRDGDPLFHDNLELFETVAEHLALAINSALMFENFESLANLDALTGLANHRVLYEFLNARVLEAKRTDQPIGVMMLDVDHFRSFNEEEGHDAGDEVLKLVAEQISSCKRTYDLAARYGGEEFSLIMPGCTLENTLSTAERIRKKVENLPSITRTGRERHVTISIGCSAFPSSTTDAAGLIQAADEALYLAKRGGRNQCRAFEGEFHGRSAAQPQLDRVPTWIPSENKAEAEARLGRLEDDVLRLAPALHLSPSQIEILRALILIAPSYRELRNADSPQIAEMEAAEEFRLLLPSLHALEERFDGRGKLGMKSERISLLGRILSVLLALDEDDGRELVEDPRRFDPEIVSLLLELRNAA